MSEVTIVGYEPKYAPDFKSLNVEWIQKYFTVEAHDLMELENPEEFILSKGGHILFAKWGEEIAGTCALIKTGEHEFYLAKMGVAPAFQGKQIGKLLGIAAIDRAKAEGAKRVWLESNRALVPAINLYLRLGFVEIPIEATPYARADIRMELWL
jgi:GNAT superfamily N-acetyltransferase